MHHPMIVAWLARSSNAQTMLDKKTDELLEQLAVDRAGNRSKVLREAIQYYADILAGRLIPHSEITKAFQAEKRANRAKR